MMVWDLLRRTGFKTNQPSNACKNNTDITSLTAVNYDGKSSRFTTIVGFLVFKRSHVVKHINFAFPPFSKNTSHE